MIPLLLAADPSPPLAQRLGVLLAGLAGLWPLWLPLVVGAAAIFWLLPRPRGYPAWWGVLAGVLALLLGGGLLVQHGIVWQENLLFYAFSGIAVAAGALLVTQQNPARAALSFALVVLATCGLFLLLAAPFLMAATIIVYAGAIVVTFLFVIMLAQQEGRSDADARSREPLLATITGFALLAVLLYVIQVGSGAAHVDRLHASIQKEMLTADPPERNEADALGRLLKELRYDDLAARLDDGPMREKDEDRRQNGLAALLNEARQRYAVERSLLRPSASLPLSDQSGPPAGTPRDEVRRDEKTGLPVLPAENAAHLGRSLFTDYLLPVELGGFLLLVATVGAVAIGQRRARPRPADSDGTSPTRVI